MSIPDRLFRISTGKIKQIFDLFDKDDEALLKPELLEKIKQAQARRNAHDELHDSLQPGGTVKQPSGSTNDAPSLAERLRTPEEISRGSAPAVAPTTATTPPANALAPHYRALGLEPGTDFAVVAIVYEKLAERCRLDRFPEGSEEAKELQEIRERLDASYKALRSALDPTVRRFELLELT